jgi:hypothetical protein
MNDELIRAIDGMAGALRALGTGDALTHMGAIELLAKELKEGSERIADSLDAISSSILATID